MQVDDLIQEWKSFAQIDYASADHLFKTMHPKPLEIICYHCQQAAEKIIKAVLIFQGKPLIKTHNLSFLIDQVDEVVPQKILDACDDLNIYGVKARYPQSLNIAEKHCEKALSDADKIMTWCLSVLEK